MFGVRLKEERKRLGLTQPQLAEVVGSAKRTVIDWEKDKSSPTAIQLIAMVSSGIDTNYLITGKRTELNQIPADELFLLDSYRKLPEDRKKVALQFLIGGFDGLIEGKKIQGIVGSPNSKIIDSFNTQSGFTDIQFAIFAMVLSWLSWILALLANYWVVKDIIKSMILGVPAVILWGFAVAMGLCLQITPNKARCRRQTSIERKGVPR